MNKIEKEENAKKNSGKKESNNINYNDIKNNKPEEKIKIKNIAIYAKKKGNVPNINIEATENNIKAHEDKINPITAKTNPTEATIL